MAQIMRAAFLLPPLPRRPGSARERHAVRTAARGEHRP